MLLHNTCLAGQGRTGHGPVWQGRAGAGMAGHGMVLLQAGMAWHGMA